MAFQEFKQKDLASTHNFYDNGIQNLIGQNTSKVSLEQFSPVFRKHSTDATYIRGHVGCLVVAIVTHAAIHQHVRVTHHLPSVQFARLPARRHALPVDLVLGTDDLLLAALLAAGKRTVCTGAGMRKRDPCYRQQKDESFIVAGTERQYTVITSTYVKATLLQMLKR